MIDYFRIARLTESDFDKIFENIGGRRYSSDDSIEHSLNCDYVYKDALVELKIIEEGPDQKESKRQKIAQIFKSKSRTVVIDPCALSLRKQRQYYRSIESPIKNALKKSSKQLKISSDKINIETKISIIINNGLTLTMPEEFESIAMKCAKNDTSGIDILMVGGAYLFSDKFDAAVIFPMKGFFLGKERQDLVDGIRDGWSTYINQYMSRVITEENFKRDKDPLLDIFFELDGIRYVKPAPQWGEPSKFWPGGIRPREDTSGINEIPPVATIFPLLDSTGYVLAKKSFSNSLVLKNNYRNYTNWASSVSEEELPLTCPLLTILVPSNLVEVSSFSQFTNIAMKIFVSDINKLIEKSSLFSDSHQSLNYILMTSVEIGIDKSNDIADIEHIIEYPQLDNRTTIIEGERLKFDHALALASAYCIKCNANCVYYRRDEKYKWV